MIKQPALFCFVVCNGMMCGLVFGNFAYDYVVLLLVSVFVCLCVIFLFFFRASSPPLNAEHTHVCKYLTTKRKIRNLNCVIVQDQWPIVEDREHPVDSISCGYPDVRTDYVLTTLT